MKNLRFLIPALFFVFGLVTTSSAQEYRSAVGARLGSPLSASFKTFINESNALEAYVGFRSYSLGYNWVSVSGAYLVHKPIDGVDGLQWYLGGGASVYFWSFDFSTDSSTTTIGIQGYAGLDYKFENIPLSLTVDWIPTVFLNSYISGFGSGYGSLGVRYVLSE